MRVRTDSEGGYDHRGELLPLELVCSDPGLRAAVLRGRGVDASVRSLRSFEHEKDEEVLSALARDPALTDEMALHLAATAEVGVVASLAFRPDLPAKVAEAMATDEDERIRTAAAMCANLPGPSTIALAKDPDQTVRRVLAMFASLPPEGISIALADPDPEVRKALATNLRLGTHRRDQFARGDDPLLRRMVATRLDLPLSVVATLAADPVPAVRAAVAARPGLSSELARRLSEDLEESVREAVGEGRQAFLPPGWALPLTGDQALVLDAYPLRRAWAAINFELPRELYRRLAGDANPLVRTALAFNPRVEPRVLSRLAADPHHETRRAALTHPALPEEAMLAATAAPGADRATALTLLGHERLSSIVVARLASHPEEIVRRMVAFVPRLPRSAFEKLAQDPSPWVRRTLAGRWDFPGDWYHALAGGDDVPVLEALAEDDHPGQLQSQARARVKSLIGPGSAASSRAKVAAQSEITRELEAKLVRDADRDVRAALAANPATGSSHVLRLARDPEACVRRAVAQRSYLTKKVLEVLAADVDPEVVELLSARTIPSTGNRGGEGTAGTRRH